MTKVQGFLVLVLGFTALAPAQDTVPIEQLAQDEVSVNYSSTEKPARLGQAIPLRNWPVNLDGVQLVPEGKISPTAVPSAPSRFITLNPCRVADTRGFGFTGEYGPPALAPSGERNFTIGGQCGIPAGASAVSFNFTVAEMGSAGNLKIYPTGSAAPGVSSINWTSATFVIANAALVPLGTSGQIRVRNESTTNTHLIIDINGYFEEEIVVTTPPAAVKANSYDVGTIVNLTNADTTLTTLTVTYPANGQAVILSEATFQTGTADIFIRCNLQQDSVEVENWFWEAGDTDNWYDLMQHHSTTRSVTAGAHSYSLRCRTSSGTASTTGELLTVMFFPSALP